MELRDIEIFLTLAEGLHFGRAANRLRVTPARVSQAIKKQERRIGTPLFDRSPHHVTLTPIGQQLRADLQDAYELIHEGIDTATATARGQIGTLTLRSASCASGRSPSTIRSHRYVPATLMSR